MGFITNASETDPSAIRTEEAEVPQTGGFWIRAVARGIDSLVGLLMLQVTGAVVGGPADWRTSVSETMWATIGWGFLATGLYYVACESVGGATFGKVVCGLRVTSQELTPCTVRGAVIRHLACWVDFLVFGLPAYFAMRGTVLHQRYGDKWGHAAVLKASAVPEASRRPAGAVLVGLFIGSAASSLCMAAAMFLKGTTA